MKQNTQPSDGIVAGVTAANLAGLAQGLVVCVVQFERNDGLSVIERAVRLAFGNGVFLALRHPGDAASLLAGLQEAGVPGGDADAAVEAFRGFRCRRAWIATVGDRLATLWGVGGRSLEGADEGIQFTLFALFVGLLVATQLPDVASDIDDHSDGPNGLNVESQFLASRLLSWRRTGWQPVAQPFVEFASGFYSVGSKECEVVPAAMGEVLAISPTFPDRWAVKIWAEAGWWAGRRIGEQKPELMRELFADETQNVLEQYLALYLLCVLETLSDGDAVRPERAALHYFAITGRDVYARAVCRGDQPRFVARAAYDFTFWMGLLSTQPMPAPTGWARK
ncbi:MAG: hypothetical protein NTV51_12920 [Verrucomicrobia bacterium]|nr:hypothetical protein [Verrucomicrobiota bacterium]